MLAQDAFKPGVLLRIGFLSPADILRQEDGTGFAVGDVIILGQDIAQGVAEGGAGDIDEYG